MNGVAATVALSSVVAGGWPWLCPFSSTFDSRVINSAFVPISSAGDEITKKIPASLPSPLAEVIKSVVSFAPPKSSPGENLTVAAGAPLSTPACETLTDDEILFEIKVAAAPVPEMSGLVLCSAARNRGRNWRGTVDELTNFGEKLESAIDGRSVAVVGWRWPYVA